MFSRRPGLVIGATLLVLVAGGGVAVAQLETGERGIPPLDSASTLEIGGIRVDVSGDSAEAARLAGWRLAQREGFARLWAQLNRRPVSEAPDLPDSTLDGLVSSIAIEQERIAPGRYVATLGVLFDRSRSAALLGAQGPVQRSAPLLLIPVLTTGGTETSVQLRNAWQRAWAEFRTANSAIDYVRVSGQGIDPLLVTAAQTRRPGRAMWRNLVDFHGAADALVAEAQLRRIYPGGPAVATFIGYFGPDRRPLGAFTLRASDSAGVPRMMAEGVRQMDALFTRWLEAGELRPDPSLIVPPPPPVEEEEEADETDGEQAAETGVQLIQIVVTAPYSPVPWLRSIPGVSGIQEYGSQVMVVRFRGSAGELASELNSRGWRTANAGGVLTIRGWAPLPDPTAPAQPAPEPATPQPQPGQQPQPTTGNSQGL